MSKHAKTSEEAEMTAENESPAKQRKPFPWKSSIGGVLLVGLAAGVIVAEPALKSISTETATFEAPVADVPSADTVLSCAATPALVNTDATTDSQFTADTTEQTTGVSVGVLSDAGSRIPGVSITSLAEQSALDGSEESSATATAKHLTQRIPEKQATQLLSSGEDGTTNVVGKNLSDSRESFAKLAAQSLGNQPTMISGMRTTLSRDGDLAGYSSAPCMAPSYDQWLVGASTAAENTSILTIANPSDSPATVSVSVYGSTDEEPQVGTLDRLVIAPGAQYSTLVGGIVPNDPAVSLRVQSQGGAVSASIQQSALRGLVPAGIDTISSGVGASTDAVVPFVWVQSAAATKSLTSGAEGRAGTELLVSVPGAAAATVKAVATDASGTKHTIEIPNPLPGGRTSAVSLDALPAGSYAIRVSANRSIVAGARTVRGDSVTRAHDSAFIAAGERLSQRQLVTLPEGGNPYVLLSTDDAAASVSLRSLGSDGTLGQAITHKIAANSTLMVDTKSFESSRSFVLDTSGGAVYGGGLSVSGKTGVTAFTIQPSSSATQGIPVILQ